MRIAFISDIHGNLHPLELVLADIHQAEVDQIICLGDVASLGPQPREVIARLRELQIPTIMGNHDNYLLNPKLTENQLPWLRELELWCTKLLSKDELDFLRYFQSQISVSLDKNTSMTCFHGSLRSNEEFLFPDTRSEILDEIFAGQSINFFVGGHTHVQMLRQYKELTLLNPGSVGMPFEYPMRGPDQHAFRRTEYAIVDMNNGKLTFDLRRIPIDFKQLAEAARVSGMPNWEFWLKAWEAG